MLLLVEPRPRIPFTGFPHRDARVRQMYGSILIPSNIHWYHVSNEKTVPLISHHMIISRKVPVTQPPVLPTTSRLWRRELSYCHPQIIHPQEPNFITSQRPKSGFLGKYAPFTAISPATTGSGGRSGGQSVQRMMIIEMLDYG